MSEEKNMPKGMNVIIESDGDRVKAVGGNLCLVAAVGDESAESFSYGNVNMRDAYAIIDAASRQIGAIADKAGIGASAAKAVACDGIVKQMDIERGERLADSLGSILDKLERDSGGCPCFDPRGESDNS